jgi:hypothetical protein
MLFAATVQEEDVKVKETAVHRLSDLLAANKYATRWHSEASALRVMSSVYTVRCRRAEELAALLTELRPFFAAVAKAKTAKIGTVGRCM